jgi:cytosine/adenosine deaminase-related metal-dependent hydrolase
VAAALLPRRRCATTGYDIADYENIHPSYGTIQDFERFMDEAHKRGIRVITELVVNHTSGPASMVPGGAPRAAGSPERDVLRLVRDQAEIPGRPHHLHRHRDVELVVGRHRARLLTGTASFTTSRT